MLSGGRGKGEEKGGREEGEERSGRGKEGRRGREEARDYSLHMQTTIFSYTRLFMLTSTGSRLQCIHTHALFHTHAHTYTLFTPVVGVSDSSQA